MLGNILELTPGKLYKILLPSFARRFSDDKNVWMYSNTVFFLLDVRKSFTKRATHYELKILYKDTGFSLSFHDDKDGIYFINSNIALLTEEV